MTGVLASSMYSLKDLFCNDAGSETNANLFVFSDLSIRERGVFFLQFNAYLLMGEVMELLANICSEKFEILSTREFQARGGLGVSTPLSVKVSYQGVKLQLRSSADARQSVVAIARTGVRGRISTDSNSSTIVRGCEGANETGSAAADSEDDETKNSSTMNASSGGNGNLQDGWFTLARARDGLPAPAGRRPYWVPQDFTADWLDLFTSERCNEVELQRYVPHMVAVPKAMPGRTGCHGHAAASGSPAARPPPAPLASLPSSVASSPSSSSLLSSSALSMSRQPAGSGHAACGRPKQEAAPPAAPPSAPSMTLYSHDVRAVALSAGSASPAPSPMSQTGQQPPVYLQQPAPLPPMLYPMAIDGTSLGAVQTLLLRPNTVGQTGAVFGHGGERPESMMYPYALLPTSTPSLPIPLASYMPMPMQWPSGMWMSAQQPANPSEQPPRTT